VGNTFDGLRNFSFHILSVSLLTLALRRMHLRRQLEAHEPFGDIPTVTPCRR
jgi:hypothetical protein